MNEPELEFKIRLEGPGLSVERNIPEHLAKDITLAIMGARPLTAPSFSTPVTELSGGAFIGGNRNQFGGEVPPTSIREFLNHVNANRLSKQITSIGVYLKRYQKKETFGREELVAAFEQANEPVPKNLPRDLGKTVQAGWIAEKSNQSGQYYVTSSGLNAVDGRFENAAPPSRLRAPRRKKSQSDSSTDEQQSLDAGSPVDTESSA